MAAAIGRFATAAFGGLAARGDHGFPCVVTSDHAPRAHEGSARRRLVVSWAVLALAVLAAAILTAAALIAAAG